MQTNDTEMTAKSLIARLVQQEDINFLLTNRIPRRAGDAVHGVAEPDRTALGVRPLHCLVAVVLGSRLERSEGDPVQERARLLYPGTQGGCASHRSAPRAAGQSLRRTDRRLRQGGSRNGVAGQGVSVPARGSAGRRGAGALLPGRPVRDAAADFEHVSPLSRSRRLPGGAGELHLRGHLERESDRAQARRATVLQERTGGHSLPSDSRVR